MLDHHDDVVTQNSEQEARQRPGVVAVFCHRGRETEPSCVPRRTCVLRGAPCQRLGRRDVLISRNQGVRRVCVRLGGWGGGRKLETRESAGSLCCLLTVTLPSARRSRLPCGLQDKQLADVPLVPDICHAEEVGGWVGVFSFCLFSVLLFFPPSRPLCLWISIG